MTQRVRATILILLGLSLIPLATMRAEESHVRATLSSPFKAVAPGQSISLTIDFEIDPDWHIYWRNPGDAGTATEMEWTLPPGYTIDQVSWPLPHTIGEPPEVSYGYEHRVQLGFRLRAPATAKPGDEVEIGVRVKWLVCHEICIPGGQTLKLQLPVQSHIPAIDMSIDPSNVPPRPLASGEAVGVVARDSVYILRVSAPWIRGITNLAFYPYDDATIDHSAPQGVERIETGESGGDAVIVLKRSPFAAAQAKQLRGVIVAITSSPSRPDSRFGIEIDVPVQ